VKKMLQSKLLVLFVVDTLIQNKTLLLPKKLKYGIRIFMNPGDYTEIGTAGIVSLGAISARSSTRAALPYTAMLIGMDAAHLVMRQMKEAEDD